MTNSENQMPLFVTRWLYYLTSIFTIVFGMLPMSKVIATFLGINRKPFVMSLRNGLTFKVRNAMDLWIIKETCLDRDYETYGTLLVPGWTIVDIGGGLGDFVVYASYTENAEIHVYEPFPESRDLLKENLKLNQVDDVFVHAEAVGAGYGQSYLNTSTGIAVRHSTAQIRNDEDLAIDSIPLAEVVKRLNSGHIDFLKMDCEGAEYDILLNADDTTLSAISRICMEYHDNLTPHTHHELVNFLSSKGFDTITYRNPAHNEIGFLYAKNT